MATAAAPVRFIGRQRELATIDAAIKDALSGNLRVVFVSGEAGVGKSRLVAEAVDRARRSGFTVLVGG